MNHKGHHDRKQQGAGGRSRAGPMLNSKSGHLKAEKDGARAFGTDGRRAVIVGACSEGTVLGLASLSPQPVESVREAASVTRQMRCLTCDRHLIMWALRPLPRLGATMPEKGSFQGQRPWRLSQQALGTPRGLHALDPSLPPPKCALSPFV
jgi:hypothetical protein